MRNLFLTCLLAVAALAVVPPPAHAADSFTSVDSGDTYTVRVWDTDDSEWQVAFVCISGEQPLCDMPNNAVMRYNGATLEEFFGQYSLSNHEHEIPHIIGLEAALAAKQAVITPAANISPAATGAETNLPTNYNLVSGILGVAEGLNGANEAQNDLAEKYNALASRFNTLIGHLEAQGLQTP